MDEPHPGTVLSDRYELHDVVGEGGMASVWRATDRVLDRPVAVKVLYPNLASNPAFLERFRAEALASARLTHPNIVNVFDTGTADGTTYIVMELMDGPTLRQLLVHEGSLPPEVIVPIMVQVLDALQFAHESGVIHRDVKPSNILVSSDGRAKVTDFGIAKAAYSQSDDPTTTGRALGSVPYLSPEQVQGEDVDAHSDVYSAGATMYEALTGRLPFAAANELAAAMLRLTRDPTPPRAIRSGIPRALDAIVLRAMARAPGDRFASAEDMAAALRRLQVTAERPPVEAPPHPPQERHAGTFRSWMLVPLLFLLAAGAAITVGILAGRLEFGGPLGVRPKHSPTQSSSAAGSPIRILHATGFDPFGDQHEHDDVARLAIDGDPSTIWQTEGYDQPILSGKPGVGLLFDLGRPRTIDRFKLVTPLPGWPFQIFVGNDRNGLVGSRAPSFMAAPTMERSIPPVTGRFVLLWITRAVPAPDGKNRAEVGEFQVFGS